MGSEAKRYTYIRKVIDTVSKYWFIIENANLNADGQRFYASCNGNVILSNHETFLKTVHSELGGELIVDPKLGMYIYTSAAETAEEGSFETFH